jgi:hypothetical protein
LGFSAERKDMTEASGSGFHFGNIGGNVSQSAGDVAEIVGKFAMKYGPLLLSARHLFGLA